MDRNNDKKRIKMLAVEPVIEFDYLTVALRQMHDIFANEPVPDDFLDLLDRIDAKMSATKKFQ